MSISVLEALKTFKQIGWLGLVLVAGVFFGYWVNAAFFTETAPTQPIAFSHRIHAQDNEIPCMHCHVYAATSISAGVPSVNKCINCHANMPGVRDQPEIVKLFEYWESKEPIPWIKVHDLPDFVYFPHKRHIQAGLECQQCHGPIQEMEVVDKVSSLAMKWCLDCHTERHVDAGRDCWTCHK